MGTNITGIGNANAIGFKSRVTGGAYFPPELKDALVGVWSAYGKSNDSTDRNIIKNKIKDKGGDFVISNAAFKLNSGFGKYEVDFTSWIQTDGVIASSDKVQNSIIGRFLYFNTVNKKEDVPSFKVNITLGQQSKLQYNYIKEDGTTTYIVYSESGIYTIPASYFSKYTGGNAWFGFYQIEGTSIIEQIPSFEGAFVTDGIDDQIVSTKTIQEMLGGSNEITVVSMIHLVQTPAASSEKAYTNQIRTGQNYLRNYVTDNGKTGIYGYTCKGNNVSVINNILGDKNDYTVENKSWNNLAKFSVIGYEDNGTINELDQVAWYWTFIAKRVLTEDEINLVIEKYNLDRPGEIVKPQVYYNVKKQKISNDNHSAFDDKLIDYSGNGYDAKLYNFGWKEDSGIGKYETDFTDWKKSFKVTSFDSESIKFTSDVSWALLYHPSSIGEDIPSFKVRIKLYGKGTLYYKYITQEGKCTNVAVKSEIFETPICYNTKYTGEKGVNVGFTLGVISGECSGTITQIPEYENALVLDGVDDYGKVTGLPILKDYTVAADYIRTFAKENAQDSPILSKSKVAGSGAFLFNYLNADSITSSYSFGTSNILKEINDSERKIYYLSKYASDGHNVNAGSAVDYDTMWLGTYRDNTSNFFTGALYFAMLFPYSLSEFLLERQIKKARAGTLYPNQVEFRPIIPEDENITKIDYFVVNSGTWTIIKPGDYVDVGARIVFNIYTKLPYKVAGVSSTSFTGMSIRPSTGLNIFDVQGYIKDKTPQKIKLTLAVNEDIIQWNPTISANIPDSYDAVTEWFTNGWETKITVGDWIKKSDRIFFKLKLKEPLHEIGKVTFGGSECQATKASNWSESNNLWEIVTYSSVGDLSQVFNVQVDEYIRYEDIVQPYPVLLRFKDENGNEVSWGGKFRVGSTITRIGSAADSNLLPNIYNIFGLLLNDNQVTSSKVIVEKTMVFKAKSAYIFDNNEPKCIFSPSKLRIPNSSYKYLGYIPDISGNGNNGTFYNFAYEGMSGANGYSIIFGDNKTYQYLRHSTDFNPTTINFAIKSINAYTTVSLLYSYIKQSGGLTSYNKYIPSYKIRVSGIKEGFTLKYTYIKNQTDTSVSVFDIVSDGVHIIPPSYQSEGNLTNNDVWIGFTLMGTFSDLYNITVEVLPDYEGSICFDGVDDYIKIDTTGGMTMLMKANVMSTTDRILYDQRDKNSEGNMYKEFAVLTSSSDSILAYAGRNPNGKTYIDGVLNTNITCGQLLNITHNITALPNSNLVGTEQGVRIGASVMPASYCKAAVFDFMLFDTKCTDDVIKQLNDIIGIEGDYVQKPSYYWDAYGKSNFDGDKETIPQLGTAESYSFASFDNELDWYLSSNNYIDVVSRNGYKITLKNLSTGIDGWRFQNSTVKRFISNDIPFKIKSDKTVRVYWDMHYNAISSTELRQKVVSVTTINPNEDTLINLRHLTEEELTELNVNKSTMYYLLWFDVSTLAVNEEVTIEMLPAEGGRDLWLNNYGVAYDKMSGYGGYSFKSFNDSADSWNIRGDGTGVEIISRDGYSMTIKKLVQNLDWHISNNEYRYPTVLSKELPFRCKSNKNVGLIWKLKYKTEGATSDTTVTLLNQQLTPNVPLEVNLPYKTQEELTELGAVSTSVYYLLYFSNTTLAIGEEYTVEMLPLYPNGLVLDGVDDYLENLDIPALSDFTVITKRTNLLEEYGNNVSYLVKGIAPTGSRDWALLMEYWYDKLCMNFIYDNSVGNYITPFDSIGFVTPTSYNGLPMTKGISNDTAGLRIARRGASYWNGVFYKLMLYPRTTNMLTINMIKNMMAEDGIIDVQGKLFTDKYTGDFYNLDFNKDFLIGN